MLFFTGKITPDSDSDSPFIKSHFTGIIKFEFKYPEDLNEVFGKNIFYFEIDNEDSVNNSKKFPSNEKKWFHIYVTGMKGYKKDFFRISLLGKFTDKGFTLIQESNTDPKSKKQVVEELVLFFNFLSRFSQTEVKIITHTNYLQCNCNIDKNFDDAKPSGTVFVLHTYALFNFLENEDFNEIPKIYDFYIKEKNLCDEKFSDVSQLEDQYIKDGDSFSIFKKRLHKAKINWLVKKTLMYSVNPNSPNETKYYLRLSKNGIIEVREEFNIEDNMSVFLEDLLRFRKKDSRAKNSNENDSLLEIVKKFVKLIIEDYPEKCSLKTEIKNIGEIKTKPEHIAKKDFYLIKFVQKWVLQILGNHSNLSSQPKGEKVELRERQRYVVIMFNNIECNKICKKRWFDIIKPKTEKRCKNTISAKTLQENISVVQNILEGTLIFEEDSLSVFHPEAPQRVEKEIKDISTWKNEMCVFGTERCFIYFQPKTVLESEGKVINYEDYWKCIVRGIEHTISVRTSLQILESATEKYMQQIPKLVTQFQKYEKFDAEKQINKKETYNEINKEINLLATNVSRILKYLPSLREVCVPTSAFRSSHAVDKFQFLNEECFRFTDILNHIQQNIDEMTNFLLFFKQQQLVINNNEESSREGRFDRYLTILGVILAFLATFYVAPSFINDFKTVCEVKADGIETTLPLLECILSQKDYAFIYISIFFTALFLGINGYFWIKYSPSKIKKAILFAGLLSIFIPLYFIYDYFLPFN